MLADLMQLQQATGIPAAGAVAQQLHEAWNPGGQTLSRLAGEYNNYAGLKWASWQRDYGGRPVSLSTWEEIDGNAVQMDDAFCAFPSWGTFLEAYAALLRFDRYRPALAYASQPLLWLHQVVAAGYATDSRYLAGPGRWMTLTWSDYADTIPGAARAAVGRTVDILDPAGRLLCVGWLQDPDGPGPEEERTVNRTRELAEGLGLAVGYEPDRPAVRLSWPGTQKGDG
jgi:hypothetical protein